MSTPDITSWVGRWVNTRPDTDGILAFEVTTQDGHATLQVTGAGPDGAVAWGDCPAQVFACEEEDGVPSSSLLAEYVLPFMRTQIQLRRNKGIAPLMTWTTFSDGRGSYFHREFFRRATEDDA